MCNSNNTFFSSNRCKSTLSGGGGTRKHAEAGTPTVRNKDCSKLKQGTARNKKKKSEENATSHRTILQNERKISKIRRKTHGKAKKNKTKQEKKQKSKKYIPPCFEWQHWSSIIFKYSAFLDKIFHNVNYFRKIICDTSTTHDTQVRILKIFRDWKRTSGNAKFRKFWNRFSEVQYEGNFVGPFYILFWIFSRQKSICFSIELKAIFLWCFDAKHLLQKNMQSKFIWEMKKNTFFSAQVV